MAGKKAPELRFKGFTDDWEQRKLGELASFSKGAGYTKGDLTATGKPIILYGRLYTKYEAVIENVDTFVDEKEKSVISNGNEVIVPASGETSEDISRASVVAKPGIILGGDLNIVKPKKEIDPLFLALTISNGRQQKELSKKAQGKSVVHLHNSDLKEVNLVYPHKEEQSKIGTFFKHLDDTLALHQRKLEQLQVLKQAYLQQMFLSGAEQAPKLRFANFNDEWKQCKLGDLGSVSMNKRIFKNQTSATGDVPFFKIGTFGGQADAYISRDLFEEYKSKYPYPSVGDILISASGSIGRTVVYQGNDEYFQDSNIIWLDHKGRIDNTFLLQFYSIVKWTGLEGSTIKRLYNKNILDTSIILPSLEEQSIIGTYLNQLDNTITFYQQKINRISKLKSAYLQKMFI